MANRKERRDFAKSMPAGYELADIRDGELWEIHLAAVEGKPAVILFNKKEIVTILPALQIVHAIASMMEDAYTKAKND